MSGEQEKILKEKNIELEKELAAKNHQLEIEAALEKVRAVAMGMKERADMLKICSTIYNQLELLSVKEIRNVQTAIFYEGKNTYMNYEYYAKHDKTFITETTYTNNEIHRAFADQMLKGSGEFFITHIKGDEVKDWIAYQKTTNVFIDEYLNTASSLNYYWYSLGAVALGISTYEPLKEEDIDLFKRFVKVFELSYTRYLDIEQAEAQAREAKIEAALEKVRSRSLAMQKSDELQEVVHSVFERLKELNVELYTAIIVIFIEGSKDIVWWMENKVNQQYSRILVRYTDNPYLRDLFQAKEKGKELFSKCYFATEKNELYNYLLEYTDLKHAPEQQKKFLLENEFATMSVALATKTGIHITSYSKQSFTEEENEILKRFAKVFDQAYTRFLDLQKAEAQARESQIEAALEKVRSCSLAMHHSEELSQVVTVLFERMEQLGVTFDGININTIKLQTKSFDSWLAAPGQSNAICLHVPYFDNPVTTELFNAYERGDVLFSRIYSKEEKDIYFKHLFELTDFKQLPDERKKMILDAKQWSISIAIARQTAISLHSYTGKVFSEDEHKILTRFSKVFDQAYTRFLDLQKAEAQAREAQIEAALERVRAKTMAMHKSEQLAETAKVFFEQFYLLGEIPDRMSIGIIKEESNKLELWVTDQNGNQVNNEYFFSLNEPTNVSKLYQAWKDRKETVIVDLTGQNLAQWLRFVKEKAKLPIDETKIKGRRVQNAAFFSKGLLLFTTHAPVAQEIMQLLVRFARVFDLTYTRFLDLEKAETQARKAQIEAALERVRGRAMAMQNSNELSDLVVVLFEELTKLDLILARCIIWIFNPETYTARLWMANSEDKKTAQSYFVKRLHHPYYDAIIEGWKQRNPKWVYHLTGHEKKTIDELLLNETELSQLPEAVKTGIANSLHTIVSGSFNNFGLIEASGPIALNDEQLEILSRFTRVFDLTYTRFNDLKQTEASAKEAVKQAALDRIRADIASMRTVNDLDRIIPLIWNELTILHIPFIRCGVFIMDDKQQLIHTFLSTPDGKAIAAFHIPYNTQGNIKHVLSHWHNKKNYIDYWDASAFTEFAHILLKQGGPASSEQYLKTIPQDGFYLHFLPFLQGMLYVGNTTQMGEEEIKLIQSVAGAFSAAYARYEDFNKLEAAKKQVEKTLSELKQTQQQLIQSEKMASLGELTSAIAHEIQNPLNFVNNFSEVSNELIDEMKTELTTGNWQQATEIADDVKQNLEKIIHHGKRADAIVKGMLQHSRVSTGQKEPTDINALADEYLRLSYHGIRAKDKSFNATLQTDFDTSIGKINVVPQDIGRVLLNLFNNAFYAVIEKKKMQNENYEPAVSVSSKKVDGKVEIRVRDNGRGIPKRVVDKIFQPFFTTKPTGQGTGLGLSLAYDIITKGHNGTIKVHSKEGEGSEFIIQLPA